MIDRNMDVVVVWRSAGICAPNLRMDVTIPDSTIAYKILNAAVVFRFEEVCKLIAIKSIRWIMRDIHCTNNAMRIRIVVAFTLLMFFIADSAIPIFMPVWTQFVYLTEQSH